MKTKSYSNLIIPLTAVVHLIIINGVLWLFTPEIYLNFWAFVYYNTSWLVIAHHLNFYPTGRREVFMTNIRRLAYLFAIYGFAYFSWFAVAGITVTSLYYYIFVYGLICFCITAYRFVFYMFVSHYRLKGGNYVNVVVIGRDKNLKKIRRIFDHPQFGYRYHGFFDDGPSGSPTYHGPVMGCFKYILENRIDEVYCTAAKLSKDQLQNLINFADNNLIKLKIIPDNKDIFTRSMSIEQYDNIPVLKLRTVPLETEFSMVVKRAFDVVFSSFVIITLLSWLIPLLYILIKLESPGPLFFKQKRHGLNRHAFWCIKFRSMANNADSDSKMATKNDMRITKIGRIIRKTSIDELPQFLNVFMGDMSVVGPRPHMEKHTADYEISVDKYLVRHFVKPGITGLAQVQGYRGEISTPSDILNRIRLDILYVEKWSLWLDLKIIFKTVVNAVMGEEKAY
ncbi:putative colanic acid biosynthesis UDP-glucose lipid carrier transferase [Mariniflexile fucanivorans]|uniref:Putative colanic acid biosynthesis UDP-glucose lipid carrier transferase n=1 Tax=Mariniflexile fucanivorans TaxID=264023 RepID=A0A4R1RLF4_9FLAO|nr:undecaprenyl-phosphate glucose phosphotransferase [Mariniflexile fucanivorans]TCL66710.1 putative colanic acid biosynthesis UDP-glucose lipid carrier transferase [Mariniflexile fucanivorans]